MKLLALLATVVVTLASGASAAQATFPGRNGVIVYAGSASHWVGDAEGGGYSYEDSHIAVLIRDGWRQTLARCTDEDDANCTRGYYGAPAFSPNGWLFALRAGDALALYGIHGGMENRLPQRGERDDEPSFAPRGRRLAFSSGPADAPRDLWVSRLDGRDARRITLNASAPAWSVGNWIAFVRDGGIWRIRPDGRSARRLTAEGVTPSWSPDGRRLAFCRRDHRRGGRIVRRGGVFVMHADGSHIRRLRGEAAHGPFLDVAWSPDGRKLLVAEEGIEAIDLRGDLVRVVLPEGDGNSETVSGVDWQPLP